MIAIGTTPLPNLTDLRLASKLAASSRPGAVNVINLDGRVMSVQPDGTVADRPPGADGGYEQGMVNGAWVVYCPEGAPNGKVYAFPLFQSVPA